MRRFDFDTIVVVLTLALAVGVTVMMSEELLSLDGGALAVHGGALMMLAVALQRWADG